MDFNREQVRSEGIKFSHKVNGQEVARAYLYVFYNSLHAEPVGYLEDVFVDEAYRGKGLAAQIIRRVVEEARAQGCYKIVATSRHSRTEVHRIYDRLGFKDWGLEFRLDLN